MPSDLRTLQRREIEIIDRLVALGGPEAQPLIRELDTLTGEIVATVEDRALAVTGKLLGLRGGCGLWTEVLPEIIEELASAGPSQDTP
jgi:hypothetical protein